MAFSVKAVVTLLPVFSHVEEHLGKVWIWQLLRLSGCISCCAGWLSVRSAPVLHFPGGRGLSVQGTREHGELGASFPSPGKKKKENSWICFLSLLPRSGNQGRAIANICWEKHFRKLTLRTPGEASRLPWACSTQAYLSCFCEEGCL